MIYHGDLYAKSRGVQVAPALCCYDHERAHQHASRKTGTFAQSRNILIVPQTGQRRTGYRRNTHAYTYTHTHTHTHTRTRTRPRTPPRVQCAHTRIHECARLHVMRVSVRAPHWAPWTSGPAPPPPEPCGTHDFLGTGGRIFRSSAMTALATTRRSQESFVRSTSQNVASCNGPGFTPCSSLKSSRAQSRGCGYSSWRKSSDRATSAAR